MRILLLSQVVPHLPHGGVLKPGYNFLRDPLPRRMRGDEARAPVERECAWDIVARRLEEAYEASLAVGRARERGQKRARVDSPCAA